MASPSAELTGALFSALIADQIDIAMRAAIRMGACDHVVARVGMDELQRRAGIELPRIYREQAGRLYLKRAEYLRAGGAEPSVRRGVA